MHQHYITIKIPAGIDKIQAEQQFNAWVQKMVEENIPFPEGDLSVSLDWGDTTVSENIKSENIVRN